MKPQENCYRDLQQKTNKAEMTFVSNDLSKDSNYIKKKDAIETLGISTKTIKIQIQNKGIEFRTYISHGVHYFKYCDVNWITVEKKSKFTIPDEYISSTELKQILGLTTMQLWELAQKKKWHKKKFARNVSYFLKAEVLK